MERMLCTYTLILEHGCICSKVSDLFESKLEVKLLKIMEMDYLSFINLSNFCHFIYVCRKVVRCNIHFPLQ